MYSALHNSSSSSSSRLSTSRKCPFSRRMTRCRFPSGVRSRRWKWLSRSRVQMCAQWRSWATISTWLTARLTSRKMTSRHPSPSSQRSWRHDTVRTTTERARFDTSSHFSMSKLTTPLLYERSRTVFWGRADGSSASQFMGLRLRFETTCQE